MAAARGPDDAERERVDEGARVYCAAFDADPGFTAGTYQAGITAWTNGTCADVQGAACGSFWVCSREASGAKGGVSSRRVGWPHQGSGLGADLASPESLLLMPQSFVQPTQPSPRAVGPRPLPVAKAKLGSLPQAGTQPAVLGERHSPGLPPASGVLRPPWLT